MKKSPTYVPRDPADIEVLQGWRKQLKDLRKALKRAVEHHGHEFTCSARMGMESDCTCGWARIKQMAKEIK